MTCKSAQIFCGTNLCYNSNYGQPKTFYKNAHVHKINSNRNEQKRINEKKKTNLT